MAPESLRGCSKPVRLGVASRETNQVPEGSTGIYIRCRTRHEAKCPSCAELYRQEAVKLIERGVPSSRPYGSHLLFVTLTAPGKEYFGTANHRMNGKFTGICPCGQRHSKDDGLLGVPIDIDKFDYAKAVKWNRNIPELWRRFLIALERELPHQTIEFVKVVEIQRRGLFHIHAIIRIQPKFSPRKNNLNRVEITNAIKKSAKIPVVEGDIFGKQVDVQFARQKNPKRRKGESSEKYRNRINSSPTRNTFARYLAKYATKGMEHATEKGTQSKYIRAHHMKLRSAAMPESTLWLENSLARIKSQSSSRFEDVEKIRQIEKRIRSRAQNKIQSFGFQGQFLTKSKNYSTTFTAIRAEAKQFAIKDNHQLISEGEFWMVLGFGVLDEHEALVYDYWLEKLKPKGYDFPKK